MRRYVPNTFNHLYMALCVTVWYNLSEIGTDYQKYGKQISLDGDRNMYWDFGKYSDFHKINSDAFTLISQVIMILFSKYFVYETYHNESMCKTS